MALSDPFSTTAALAQGSIGGLADPYLEAIKMAQEQKRKEAELQAEEERKKRLLKYEQEIKKESPSFSIDSLLDLFKNRGDFGLTGATIDPVTGSTKITVGQTPGAKAQQQVNTQVKKDALTRIEKLQGLIPVLDQFDQILASVPVATGIKGKVQGFGKVIAGKTGQDPFSATVVAQADALRPQVARGFGDVGNLSVVEQKTAIKFIPKTEDPADTRALKTLGGYVFIRKKVSDAISRAGLEDDDDYKKAIAELDKRIEAKRAEVKKLGVDEEKLKVFLGETVKTVARDEQPKSGEYKEGQTATNPQTGEQVIFRGGKWQKM